MNANQTKPILFDEGSGPNCGQIILIFRDQDHLRVDIEYSKCNVKQWELPSVLRKTALDVEKRLGLRI